MSLGITKKNKNKQRKKRIFLIEKIDKKGRILVEEGQKKIIRQNQAIINLIKIILLEKLKFIS